MAVGHREGRSCRRTQRVDANPCGSERNLRREAVGRKNWLFVGSEDGALANTVFVSLIASCEMHGIEPWAYLRDLFHLLPDWPGVGQDGGTELAQRFGERQLVEAARR